MNRRNYHIVLSKLVAFLVVCFFMTSFFQREKKKDFYGEKVEELRRFYENKDGKKYLHLLESVCDTIIKRKDWSQLYKISNAIFNNNDISLDSANRYQLRKVLTRYAFYFKNKLGNYNKSLKIYLKAHDLVGNKVELDSLGWYVENVIGTIYTRNGDYEKAIYFLGLVENNLVKTKNHDLLSRLYNNIGIAYQSKGNIEESNLYFLRAIKLGSNLNNEKGIIGGYQNLAKNLIESKNSILANNYFKKASKILPKLIKDKDYLFIASAQLEIEGDIYLLNNEIAKAINNYRKCIDSLQKYFGGNKRREISKMYKKISIALLKDGKLDDAKISLDSGLMLLLPLQDPKNISLDMLYGENTFTEIFLTKSIIDSIYFSISNDELFLEEALKHITIALHANEIQRESYAIEPSKLLSISENKNLCNRAIALLYEKFKRSNDETILNDVRIFFNKSKSILLNEKIINSQLLQNLENHDQEKWVEAHNKISELYSEINKINNDSILGEIMIRKEFINKIKSKYKINQRKTEVNGNFIEYNVNNGQIFVLSRFDNQLYFNKIGDVSNLMRDYAICMFNQSSNLNVLKNLNKEIFEKINKSKIGSKITIIPDDYLCKIAFESLISNNGKYLLEEYNLNYALHFESLKNKPSLNKKYKIIAIAPQYKNDDIVSIDRGNIYHLPYSREEVINICKLFPEKSKIEQEVNKNKFYCAIDSCKILHFAGHGFTRNSESFLALGQEKETFIESQEISNRIMNNELIVLSACETGLGKLDNGEGINSIGKAFLQAGVRSVLMTLWTINDQSGSRIMKNFYENIPIFNNIEALKKAKLSLLKGSEIRYRHPYHWSGFILIGENPIESNRKKYIIISSFIIGALILIFHLFQNQKS